MNNSKNTIWYLKQIDLFQGLSEDELNGMKDKMREERYAKKNIIYTPETENDSIYLLKEGEITIYYSFNGKKLILDVLKPGSLFGNLNFQEEKNTHFAEVSRDAFVCIFSKKIFAQIFSMHPELVFKLFQYVTERMSDYEEKLRGLIFGAKEKILNQLRILQKKNKSFLGLFFNPGIYIIHEKLAEHAGVSRETVSRTIQELKQDGLIKIDKDGKIFIV
jgi:CRP/FNR family transcriptional regulator, cyclic AMP receptor protein